MSTWLVVGLGNPGPQYAGNRHNLGAFVVGELARRYAAGTGAAVSGAVVTTTTLTLLKSHKARAHVASVRLGGAGGVGGVPAEGAAAVLAVPAAVLAVPAAYVNESGGPVKALLRFYSVPIEQLVVVHDELDLTAGAVRLKLGGGEGGHNGLRSVTTALGTKEYLRVRVGIGRPPGRMDPADFVLRDFSATERRDLPLTVSDAADAVEDLVSEGLVVAQQRWHSKG